MTAVSGFPWAALTRRIFGIFSLLSVSVPPFRSLIDSFGENC